MPRLKVECSSEQAIARALREAAVEVIEERGTNEAAKILQLAPSGVEALLWDQNWAVDKALRVAEALGLSPISVVLHMDSGQPVRRHIVGSSP